MPLTESQIQALIAVLELSRANQPADAENLAGVVYFGNYREDWTEALAGLVDQGLLARRDDAYVLTPDGKAHAERLREARPPIYYWYVQYYEATRTSAAYAQFCERVFGRDFSQHGFSDMAQVDTMLERLALEPGDRVLELGCGNGAMAEYIAEATGARVTGIDYIPEAIRQAKQRAARARALRKPELLSFHVGDIAHLVDAQSQLALRPHSFDALISVDTLYFTGLQETVRQMRALLAPGGQMALFFGQNRWLDKSTKPFDPANLTPERTPLGRALLGNGLRFEALDFSRADYQHAQLKKAVLEELRPALEAEGNHFLFKNRYAEARGLIQAFEAGLAIRHLYHVGREASNVKRET